MTVSPTFAFSTAGMWNLTIPPALAAGDAAEREEEESTECRTDLHSLNGCPTEVIIIGIDKTILGPSRTKGDLRRNRSAAGSRDRPGPTHTRGRPLAALGGGRSCRVPVPQPAAGLARDRAPRPLFATGAIATGSNGDLPERRRRRAPRPPLSPRPRRADSAPRRPSNSEDLSLSSEEYLFVIVMIRRPPLRPGIGRVLAVSLLLALLLAGTADAATRIVPIGDSLTHGGGDERRRRRPPDLPVLALGEADRQRLRRRLRRLHDLAELPQLLVRPGQRGPRRVPDRRHRRRHRRRGQALHLAQGLRPRRGARADRHERRPLEHPHGEAVLEHGQARRRRSAPGTRRS